MGLQNNKLIMAAAFLMVAAIYTWLVGDTQTTGQEATAADLRTDLPKMVELFTPTCPSCRAMDPLLDQLKKRCENRGVNVNEIDVSKRQNEHLVDELDVVAVPTFVFLDENGVETSRLIGKQTESTLEKHLATLGGQCADVSG